MSKPAKSFGLVLLLVAMAVVMLLVARAWRSVAPAAVDLDNALESPPLHDHGQPGAGDAIRSGDLPGLDETGQAADAHTADVQEALKAID